MDIDVATPADKEEDKTEPPLPEGFFDDPILDAKVRNVETVVYIFVEHKGKI